MPEPTTETIQSNATNDWYTCICGNEPDFAGFAACDPKSGEILDIRKTDLPDNPHDYLRCGYCGRVIASQTIRRNPDNRDEHLVTVVSHIPLTPRDSARSTAIYADLPIPAEFA